MNSGSSSQFVSLLKYQWPLLIAYAVGLVLALINWGRQPKASLLLCLGAAVLLLVSVGMPFAQSAVIDANRSSPGSGISGMLNTVAMVGNVLRAAGIGLILAAVYAGRQPADGAGFQVMPPPPVPPFRPPPGPRM